MDKHADRTGQAGFSLVELTVTMGIMVAILGITAGLMADALRSATVSNETTDAQQALRTAHEYLNRDLLVAGDGLNSMRNMQVRLPLEFVTDNVATDPTRVATFERNGATASYAVLQLVNPDDAQTRSAADAALRADTDRVTVMSLQPDPNFPVSIIGGPAGAYGRPDPNTLVVNMPSATAAQFRPGEVVFVSSTASASGTFAAVTGVTTGATGQLRFTANDAYGLNTMNLPLLSDVICGTGTAGTPGCYSISIQRVLLVTYFVDADGLLRRRVLGKPRRGTITETDFVNAALAGEVIAEHVTALDARYGLVNPDDGGAWDIVDRMTFDQQQYVRQVEIKLTAETPHAVLAHGQHATATSVVRTSVRTLEYRWALGQ